MLKASILACLFAVNFADSTNDFGIRALALTDHIVSCSYVSLTGNFINELEWQSGNTLETLSRAILLSPTSSNTKKYIDIISNTYTKTAPVFDNCYDDHQWWLLAWVRAYESTGDVRYLERASIIFDNTTGAWSDSCAGGVEWCPTKNPDIPYKNAITNELFFSSAMYLHKYVSKLPSKDSTYFLDWALKEWKWFEQSGMLNSESLINDGLNNACVNNMQTTWTYNQGVLLSGLGLLAVETENITLVQYAKNIIEATMIKLTSDGILIEPCHGECNSDQSIFKGVFVRHLSYFLSIIANSQFSNAFDFTNIKSFISANSLSMIHTDNCLLGGFGIQWEGPCTSKSATNSWSAALDLLITAAENGNIEKSQWQSIGIGNCVDTKGESMPNCFKSAVSESSCREAAFNDNLAVAYDYKVDCFGTTSCRVRTTSKECGSGFTFTDGSASTVNGSNGSELAICVVKNLSSSTGDYNKLDYKKIY